MKSGMIFLLFIAAFLFAICGLFTWYALAGDWVNTNMPSDFQTVTRWEVVIALWGGLGVVLIGAFQGAKDSGWELPTYETFDRGIPPVIPFDNPARRRQRPEDSDGLDLEEWPRR